MINDNEDQHASIKTTKNKTELFLLSTILFSIISIVANKILVFFGFIFFMLTIISGIAFACCIPYYLKALEKNIEK